MPIWTHVGPKSDSPGAKDPTLLIKFFHFLNCYVWSDVDLEVAGWRARRESVWLK